MKIEDNYDMTRIRLLITNIDSHYLIQHHQKYQKMGCQTW